MPGEVPTALQVAPIPTYQVQERDGPAQSATGETSLAVTAVTGGSGLDGLALCQSRGRGFKSRRARQKAERMQGAGVSLRQPLARVCARIVYDGASVALGIVALNVALRA